MYDEKREKKLKIFKPKLAKVLDQKKTVIIRVIRTFLVLICSKRDTTTTKNW